MSTPSAPTPPSAPPPERPLPPAVTNGILPLDRLPPVRPLPDDPATRDARYLRAAAMLEQWAHESLDGEPDWEVETLLPPDRPR